MSTASFIVPAGDPIDIDEYTDEFYGSVAAQDREIRFYAAARMRATTDDSYSTSHDGSSDAIPTAPVVSSSRVETEVETESTSVPLIVLPPPPAAFEESATAENGTELAWQEETGRTSAITVDAVDEQDASIPEAYVAGSRPPLPSPVVEGTGMRRNSRDQRSMREDADAVNWKSASNPHRETAATRRDSSFRRSVSMEPPASSSPAAVGSPSSAGSSSATSKRNYRRAESNGEGSSATSDTFNVTASAASLDSTGPHGEESANSKKSKGWGFGRVGRAQRTIQRGLQVEGSVMEKLFGDAKPMEALLRTKRRSSRDVTGILGNHPAILPRTHLPAYITHNTSTNLWIVTINTNQKALEAKKTIDKRSLKAVSVQSESEANAIVEAFAPPRMHPFDSNPSCFVCKNRFGMLNRPGHCRNCGVCVCSKCSTFWPNRMIPDTYNIKNESTVRICISCDWLATSFRTALTSGKFDEAVALYESGNVNLRTIFANLKGDEYFPVHGAVFGGNVGILRWLVDEHHCPVRYQSTFNHRKSDRKKQGSDLSLATSHGRTLLQIAAQARNVDIMRYLVVEKEVSVDEIKDIRTALLSLESTLHRVESLPSRSAASTESPARPQPAATSSAPVSPVGADVFPSEIENDNKLDRKVSALSSAGSLPTGAAEPSAPPPPPPPEVPRDGDDSGEVEVVGKSESDGKDEDSDLCIICFDKQIDCVAIPCGHQMCCLECTANLQECPVCSGPSTFIRIFRP